jgi:pimeloyl-ACP methyl ester carboxylesterase
VEFTAAHRGGAGPPLVCLHGAFDTWRTWQLVLPALERRHEVFAPTLPGHAGGPPLTQPGVVAAVDATERLLDDAGVETAHLVGNSLGGYLALALAARGRARTVVALAPAGGWDDPALPAATVAQQRAIHAAAVAAAPHADALAATPHGRRRATQLAVEHGEDLPPALVAHQLVGIARCDPEALVAAVETDEWAFDAGRVECPVRVVWGMRDRLLPWPDAASRFRRGALAAADWVLLDDVGHAPQLDAPLETAELVLGVTA